MLEVLASGLSKSGNVETSHFFSEQARLIASKQGESQELKIPIKKLSAMGAISQYANFTHRQDKLFQIVFELSVKLLAES